VLIDPHVHSYLSRDCPLDPKAVLARAETFGLDGVAFTETNTQDGCDELFDLQRTTKLKIFVGLELATDKGQYLCFFEKPDRAPEPVQRVLDPARILALQALVRRVPVADHVLEYAVRFARATRPDDAEAPPYVKEYVGWGAGPRASQFLILAGKARALLDGRLTVSREDVWALAPSVLQHRVLMNFHAEAERVTSADIVARLRETLKPR
jgi:hypothetical protein